MATATDWLALGPYLRLRGHAAQAQHVQRAWYALQQHHHAAVSSHNDNNPSVRSALDI